MINKKNVLCGCMSVIAVSTLVSMSKPCLAQMIDATHFRALSPAPSRSSGSSVSAAEEAKGTRDSATTQSTPQSGNPQSGILSLGSDSLGPSSHRKSLRAADYVERRGYG